MMKQRTVYLLGAGISVEAPASMPAALGFVKQIVHQITPHATVRRKLLNLFDASRSDAVNRSDFLRFETFMEVLQEHADPELSVLNFLRETHHPNTLHLMLAREAILGAVLITTNFDSFLEDAIRLLDSEPCTICEEREFKDWQKRVPKGHVPVFKIHGSVQRWQNGRTADAHASVIATIASLTNSSRRMRLPKHKEVFLHEMLNAARLVVAGYSAADELDVVPSLADCMPSQVDWLEFDPHQLSPLDTTADTMTHISSIYATTRTGKESLFQTWYSLLGQSFRHLRVHTGHHLATCLGAPPIPTVQPFTSLPTPVILNRHLKQWRHRLAHPTERTIIIGEVFFRLGHYRSALHWFTRGLRLSSGDMEREPMLTLFVARVLIERADYQKAMKMLKALSRAVLRRQPPARQVRYWHYLGFAHYKLRSFRLALLYYHHAQRMAVEWNMLKMRGTIIHDEGIIWQERGDYDRASQCFVKSIKLSNSAGDARHVAWSEFHLATVAFMNANLAKARHSMEAALAHARVLNDLSHASNCGHGLALIELQEGRLVDAARRCRTCISLSIAAGQREWTGMDWELLGICFWEAGRYERAVKCFKVANRALKAVRDSETMSELLACWSEMLMEQGRWKEARTKALLSLALAQKSNLPEFLARALFIAGASLCRTGVTNEGRRQMTRAFRLAAQVPVIALDLVFASVRLGLARKSSGIVDLSQLRWGLAIYRRVNNISRHAAISRAISEWSSP